MSASFYKLTSTILIGLLFIPHAMATEEPKFTVTEKSGEFELRLYAPMIVAETFVQGSLSDASSSGFRLIAAYIFGANKSRTNADSEKIAMTAPVTLEPSSTKIAMTVPVSIEKKADQWRVQFVMPSQYTLQTLPIPNNPQVHLREIPVQKFAVITFSGLVGSDKLQAKTEALLQWMRARQLVIISPPQLARYNPPWTLPFLRRNEVLIGYEE